MGKYEKLFRTLMSGDSDANIAFNELAQLLLKLGFQERKRGSHRMYSMQRVDELINIQIRGKHAKPYQVAQIRDILLKNEIQLAKEKDDV